MKEKMAGRILLTTLALGILSWQTAWAAPVDMSLEKAVAMALTNNAAIKMSEADLAAAKAGKTAAKAGRWGNISVSSQFGRGGYKDPIITSGQSGASNTFNNAISLSLPLYSESIEANIEAEAQNHKYYRYALESSLETVKLNATTGYYSVLEKANNVTVAQESVDRLAQHLKNVQAQFDVGVVAKADVLRSQVELANAQQTLIKARNAYDLAVANLNNVVGLAHDTDLSMSEGLDYKEYNNSLDNCLTYALVNRPELHQAEASIAKSKASVRSANATSMPQVSATASNKWSDKTWPGDSNENWSVGVGVSMNVFDYGVTAAKVAQARANVAKAEYAYSQATDTVRLDVRTAYLNLREAEKRIATTQTAVAQADEDYRIAVLRYQAGVGTNTDVMDAQVALTQAKTNYIQALYDYNTAGASLDKAMGVPVITETK